jgi:putative acetyltransferase
VPAAPAIRFEQAGDADAVARVNTAAFGQPQEAAIVARLRGIADPYLSLVALLDERIVGHILFTPVTIRAETSVSGALGLGPMAVEPQHQGRGIGSALVRAGLDACRRRSHFVVFVVGHPEYYPRFGFQPAAPQGLHFHSAEFDPAFMVIELVPGALAGRTGWVEFLPPFADA